jgi:FMN phosphatase YigB (HAD superfamily)
MPIRNIIFDVDDVLVDQDEEYKRFFSEAFGREVSYAEIAGMFPDRMASGSLKTPPQFKDAYMSSPIFGTRKPYSDTFAVLGRLKAAGFRMFCISAAIPDKAAAKKIRLDAQFGAFMDEIITTPEPTDKLGDIRGLLAAHALAPGETVMIDARFANLRAAMSCGVAAVRKVPDMHNPTVPDDMFAIPAVHSLSEFEKLLSEENHGDKDT